MITTIDIKYIVDGLGKAEETCIYGLKEGDYFNFVNKRKTKVIVSKIKSDSVALKFDDKEMLKMIIPDENNMLELPEEKEITLYLPIEPSPNFKLKILDIKEEKERFYE